MQNDITELAEAYEIPVVGQWWRGSPAAYMFWREDRPYYVGMAGDVERRWAEHRRAGLVLVADRLAVLSCATVQAAARLEQHLLALYEPRANTAHPRLSAIERGWYDDVRWTLAERVHQEKFGWCWSCGDLSIHIGPNFADVASHLKPLHMHEERPAWRPGWVPDPEASDA